MSVRLEWTEAAYAKPSVKVRGDRMADGIRVAAEMALAVGPLVIEGSRESLLALLDDARSAVDGAVVAGELAQP